ncbi:hypothetical protein OsI_36603 [Oryza sativa Indica Group]|uniref:EGF-like domain-containing protein n=2 Tax=Oryza sativa TaxID=4530 RepID=B9G877_ORYSJ|nr:hypothetical protein OsI_36603 [Oryza sativa Indica Group]EEE52342.1 hypothetical protein OsJ_34381 [Oryza sativa Japonica Group]
MKCSRVRLVLVMVSLQAMIAMLPDGAGAQNGDGSRCSKVRCGMGSCSESSDYVFGFACRCNPGWSRYHLGNLQFPFLPSCLLQYCGDGGSCERSSEFGHRCACHDGFQNLLNDTSYPCYRQCSLGSDCSGLGISMFNGSQPGTAPPAPFSFTVKKSGAAASSLLPAGGGVLLHLLLVLVSSFMIG